MAGSRLSRVPLFAGLDAGALGEAEAAMSRRSFAAGDVICRVGEPGESLFVIVDGLASVVRPEGDVVARLRRGDVIGEGALVTGEPRSATVVAAVPTAALELRREDFAALIGRQPGMLSNLNAILSRRLAATTARVGDARTRGEAVALVASDAAAGALAQVIDATEAASVAEVASLDARAHPEPALAALDDLLDGHGTVVVTATFGQELLAPVLEAVDRVVALPGNRDELRRLDAALAPGLHADLVVLEDGGDGLGGELSRPPRAPVRRVVLDPSGALSQADADWLGRHLSRTKLGLALGAGGAKGYAHVGVLSVLEEAGYTVDAVAGSSIGAIVGAFVALGLDAAEIDAKLRRAFREDVVADAFKLSFSGTSTGLETMTAAFEEATGGRTFDDLVLPLVVMTVGLDSRAPEPITDGPLSEALLAATALAGLFPPYDRNGARLIDGLALVPVPTDAVVEVGADVTVAVDIIGGEPLAAWPGQQPPDEEPRGARTRMLDTLLEVMDLAQFDASRRHAARADVGVSPRFGPASWRDFHLADLFLDAGRTAAEEEGLPALARLAKPQRSRLTV
jgi:NTE family protein